MSTQPGDDLYMLLAVAAAEKYVGATSPNPPVGACVVKDGVVLGVGAHVQSGAPHAEAVALDRALAKHGPQAVRGATLYVTLEPCNHHGKTPPCTDSIILTGIRRVVYGIADLNPTVKGGGAAYLKSKGIEVDSGAVEHHCKKLVAPFSKWVTTGMPWIVHKIAYRLGTDGRMTMIPDKSASTFTTQQSLREAHLERKRSDAILTGIGTVLADFPKFNVRHIPDHPNRRRFLAVISQDGTEPPQKWLEQEWNIGFEVLVFSDVKAALKQLAEFGVHRVLVEAGPTLSEYFERENLWDERLVFVQSLNQGDDGNLREPHDYAYREYQDNV